MPTFQTETRNGYAVLTLDRGTANTIEQTMVDELSAWFSANANNDSIGGVVLAGKKRFFSAGLDLITLFQYDREQVSAFWRSFMNLTHAMCAWPKPMVAAITGHAPAGGCLLAMAADFRVMAYGDYQIGLNEIPVGIPVPPAIFALYRFWLGENMAYTMLMEGKLVLAQEAHALGMVHQLAEEVNVVRRAEERLQTYLALDPNAWQVSKANLRRGLLADMQMDFDKEFAPALDIWWSEPQRARLSAIIDRLTKKGG